MSIYLSHFGNYFTVELRVPQQVRVHASMQQQQTKKNPFNAKNTLQKLVFTYLWLNNNRPHFNYNGAFHTFWHRFYIFLLTQLAASLVQRPHHVGKSGRVGLHSRV